MRKVHSFVGHGFLIKFLQQGKLVEFHGMMMNALDEKIKECEELPSQEEILALENQGRDEEGTQKPWKWTEKEIEEAKEWINSPVNRVRFLRARWGRSNQHFCIEINNYCISFLFIEIGSLKFHWN